MSEEGRESKMKEIGEVFRMEPRDGTKNKMEERKLQERSIRR